MSATTRRREVRLVFEVDAEGNRRDVGGHICGASHIAPWFWAGYRRTLEAMGCEVVEVREGAR